MAFKMKAGAGGPMKKNFPSAFKADSPADKELRALVLNKGYAKKDGKYYRKPKDPTFAIYTPKNEVSMNEATTVKRKSHVRTKEYRGFGPDEVLVDNLTVKKNKRTTGEN